MGGKWMENMRMLRGIEKQIVLLLHALGNTEWELEVEDIHRQPACKATQNTHPQKQNENTW